MAIVQFTPNLRQHIKALARDVPGTTVAEALAAVFEENPRLRGYVLDDQGRVRKHVVVFHNGEMIQDRLRQSDPITETSKIFVMQALSGG